MNKIKTALYRLYARLIAALIVARDQIKATVKNIVIARDAADAALAKIDKGIRALEAAQAKAGARVLKAAENVDDVIAAYYVAYDTAADKHRAASASYKRAAGLLERYKL